MAGDAVGHAVEEAGKTEDTTSLSPDALKVLQDGQIFWGLFQLAATFGWAVWCITVTPVIWKAR